jgi:hypothetical protein
MSSSTSFVNAPGSESAETSTTSTSDTKPLALPAVPSNKEGKAQQLDLSQPGQTVKLDALGPMVVNVDGTLSRISNWEKMTEMERKNTVRVIGKRNRERLAKLKVAEGEGKEEL